MNNNTPCILVADDEKEIRDILELLLTGEGYCVVTAGSGEEVLEAASESTDMFILDVNMPGISGFAAAAELRKKYDAPVIFLTAYSGESDKVMGFSVGADDYIVKPFSNMEVLMRVKAVLRRSRRDGGSSPENDDKRIMLRDIIIDRDSQSVIKNGEIIKLTYTEYKILQLLAVHRKKIFSLENIYQSIWEEDAVGDSTIMVHIRNLRKKLGDSSRNPEYIKTAWGKGYYVD
ncbi:MAG: response regulator transcription factor [Bacillota bacterium]|nr:response regulator transcription factor [Bacillota bacterium]